VLGLQLLSAGMATLIFIAPVKRPDGRDWYTDRSLLFRTRLGDPDGSRLQLALQLVEEAPVGAFGNELVWSGFDQAGLM
jgi:hypothetical protein